MKRSLSVVHRPLDLLRVTYIDQAGLAALRRLWPQLTIVRASLFARELLKPIEHD